MAEAAIDDLYGLALEDFVGARDALAKRLRAEGDRDGATAVKALAKPTRAAWAVNRLVRDRPEEIAALVAAGEALEGAQEQLLGGADAGVLRSAAQAARQLVDALAAEVPGGEAVRGKVRATLHAATVDPEVREAVRSGRLTRERAAAGFGGLAALAAAPATPGRPARTRAAPPARRAGPDPREVRRRRDALRRAKEAEASAEVAMQGARAALEQVEATLAARRRDLEAAEQDLSDARDRRERAERVAAELQVAPEGR